MSWSVSKTGNANEKKKLRNSPVLTDPHNTIVCTGAAKRYVSLYSVRKPDHHFMYVIQPNNATRSAT